MLAFNQQSKWDVFKTRLPPREVSKRVVRTRAHTHTHTHTHTGGDQIISDLRGLDL